MFGEVFGGYSAQTWIVYVCLARMLQQLAGCRLTFSYTIIITRANQRLGDP